MRGKRTRIRRTIAAAQKRGKHLNPKELAACYGKIRYSKERAKARAEGVSTMKFYKCKFCEYYHVGRRPRKGQHESK